MNLKSFLKNSWNQSVQIDKTHCTVTAIWGGAAHFTFPFIFYYIFHLYENFLLRMIAVALCLSFPFVYSKRDLRTLHYCYWHLAVIFVLPFIFTVNLLKTNFNELWLYWEIFMIFILILYVPNWLIVLADLLIGIGLAIIYYMTTPNTLPLKPHFNITSYSIVIISTAIFGFISSYVNRMAYVNSEKYKQHLQMTSLAGSIVHEIRNPLSTINLIGSHLSNLPAIIDEGDRQKLTSLALLLFDSVEQANEIINIALADLGNKSINSNDFIYLNTKEILPDIIEKFGYKEESEKQKVKLNLNHEPLDGNNNGSFIFSAVPERFTFIVYNLLKNALYYLKEYPSSIVTVGTEERIIDSKEYNSIYVHDTGPGIPANIIPKLFGDFFTSGKKDGTGLGLAFCKRNMKIFGGDIICESEVNNSSNHSWTKFSMLFPKLTKEEIAKAEALKNSKDQQIKQRKILLVDDQQTNLLSTKSKIENILLYISCDVAASGKEAIKLAKDNDYHLILMDIHMSEMTGIETTKKIKEFKKDLPIIAHTSIWQNTEEIRLTTNDYIKKSVSDNMLFRTIAKWLINTGDDLFYLGNKEEYQKILKDKNIILADDQEMNRMMTKRKLKSYGIKITEAKDGKELLEIYKNSLNQDYNNPQFDLIITDINMPPFNGDEAAKEIRKINQNIPIIALSGDGSQEDIYHFFACGLTVSVR